MGGGIARLSAAWYLTTIGAARGNGTTWVTTTPAPAAPSSLASASLPTKEMLTKRRRSLILLGELDELGAGLVGADHDHRVRVALADPTAPFTAVVLRLVGAFGGERQVALVERRLTPGKSGAAIGVVLVHDGDARDAEIPGQALDHLLGLLEIGGAQVDHVGLVGLRRTRRR